MTLFTKRAVISCLYVMEFKYKGCAPDAAPEEKRKLFNRALEEGKEQILGRGYADKYRGSGKEVIQAVFAFLGRDDVELLDLRDGENPQKMN